MKTSTLLLSIALAFKVIYSKAIDTTDNITSNQLNVEEDSTVEIINNDNFIYKLHCSDEKELCDKIKNDFEYAFKIISNAFEIYQPIVFEAYVDDLTAKYGLSSLGAVADINFIALKSSNDTSSVPVLYPQALTKQLNLNKIPNYYKNDFIMVINNNNSRPELKEDEYRNVIIHEMLHGLGFSTLFNVVQLDFYDYNVYFDDMRYMYIFEGLKYITFPSINPSFSDKLMEITHTKEYLDQLDNTKVSKFTPYSIYDKYLVSTETGEKIFDDNLQYYYKEINQKCYSEDLMLKDMTDQFVKKCIEKLSPEIQEMVSTLPTKYYFNKSTLGIQTKDGDIIPVQTLKNLYMPASSVIHIASPLLDKFMKRNEENDTEINNNELIENESVEDIKPEDFYKYYDENFILYMADSDDLTIEEMLELLPNNPKHPLIGDGIVKILKTLGWTEKGDKRSDEVYTVDDSIEIPENNYFKYLFMQKFEVASHDDSSISMDIETETTSRFEEEEEEEEPTFIFDEVETPLLYDLEEELNTEVDAEITLSPDQESDSESETDYDHEEEEE